MTERHLFVRLDAQNTFSAWKVLVGGRKSHQLSKPVFPRHQPNYDFDYGVLLPIKALRPVRGAIPLEDEFAKRK